MRLLDRVAQCHEPLILPCQDSKPFEVAGASRFAQQVAACPLRFVLGDDLTRASTDLAYADGARLVGCLDLLRMPAPQFWIEWNDEIHMRVIHETQSNARFDAAAPGRKVGLLLQSCKNGFGAVARTFWLDAAAADCAEPTVSPLETHFDLRGQFAKSTQDMFSGGFLDATDGANAATAALFGYVKFRFDQSWSGYYRAAAADAAFKRRLVLDSVQSVAWDAPFLLAFLLLLSARNATRSLPVCRAAINRKRCASGRRPLLDHVEVNASLEAVATTEATGDISGRQPPRLHHVRGHLVRRDQRVFWRVPHLRGNALRGAVRSRTVCLSFCRTSDREARV